jgi:hypothetical protein
MRPRRPNVSALCFLLLLLSPAFAPAQPGNELEHIHLVARYKRSRTVRIFVEYDGRQDGRRARLTGRSEKLTVNGTVGPITIKLERAGPEG